MVPKRKFVQVGVLCANYDTNVVTNLKCCVTGQYFATVCLAIYCRNPNVFFINVSDWLTSGFILLLQTSMQKSTLEWE